MMIQNLFEFFLPIVLYVNRFLVKLGYILFIMDFVLNIMLSNIFTPHSKRTRIVFL